MSAARAADIDVFYPIVPDATWVERLVSLGLRTVQLRMKDVPENEIAGQIAASLQTARAFDCTLIVNDYWREAIAEGADWIHLGQEDLADADVGAIKEAGIKLGISTHDETELATALAAKPDYVALGPIFETKLKKMPWAPQGLERIRTWKERIGELPLVAIGGITPERASAVLEAGAQSVAVITDFMRAPNPNARVTLWLDWAKTRRSFVTVGASPESS